MSAKETLGSVGKGFLHIVLMLLTVTVGIVLLAGPLFLTFLNGYVILLYIPHFLFMCYIIGEE